MSEHLDMRSIVPRLSTFHGRKRLVGILADPGDLCEGCIQGLFQALHVPVPNADQN